MFCEWVWDSHVASELQHSSLYLDLLNQCHIWVSDSDPLPTRYPSDEWTKSPMLASDHLAGSTTAYPYQESCFSRYQLGSHCEWGWLSRKKKIVSPFFLSALTSQQNSISFSYPHLSSPHLGLPCLSSIFDGTTWITIRAATHRTHTFLAGFPWKQSLR